MKIGTFGLAAGVTIVAGAYYVHSRGASAAPTPTPTKIETAAGFIEAPCNPARQTGCRGGERCAIACSGPASAFYVCEPDPGVGAGIGEACNTLNRCRRGVCFENPGSTATCTPYCESDADCAAGLVCDAIKMSFRCSADPSGKSPVFAKICRSKALPNQKKEIAK